jgi:hypothetical protein
MLIFESAVIQIVSKTSEGFVGEICFHKANKQVIIPLPLQTYGRQQL